MQTSTQRQSFELKKHIGLIHSTNKLSLLERKIANALLFNAYEELQIKSEHQIHIPSMCKLIGYNSKDFKIIRDSLISLISTVLEWNLIDKDKSDEQIWMASSMLADAKIEGSICTYSYSNRMRELCYYPEFYGRLNMQVISKFKSTYGLALYENCIRYQTITQTPWIDILTYRKLMGIEEDQYSNFSDLNRRVIKLSVDEVNNNAPINITPEIKKQGRAVIAIRFLINRRAEQNSDTQTKSKTEDILRRLKEDYGFTINQAKSLMEQYEEHYLLEKITLVESSSSYHNGKIENLSKYLEKALIENYQPPKSSKSNLDKLRIKQEQEAKQKKLYEENAQKYRYYLSDELPKILENIPGKQKILIQKDFDKYISSTVYHSVYLKHGFDDALVRDRLVDFVKGRYPEILASLLSLDEFCAGRTNERS